MCEPISGTLRSASVRRLALVAVFATALAVPGFAQERPSPAIELAGGALLFADDGIVQEGFFGGNARFHLSPRVSIGPEVAFILGENHSHFMLTGNLTCDLLSPVNGRPRAVTPFVVAGGGLFRTHEQLFAGPYNSTDGAFTAGGGLRMRVTDAVAAGAEARIGWELHMRVNAFIAVQLGDR
jgi:hypothetical protein